MAINRAGLDTLRGHARITSHLAAGPCGAGTHACRVESRLDPFCSGRPEKRRDDSRRGRHECLRHGFSGATQPELTALQERTWR